MDSIACDYDRNTLMMLNHWFPFCVYIFLCFSVCLNFYGSLKRYWNIYVLILLYVISSLHKGSLPLDFKPFPPCIYVYILCLFNNILVRKMQRLGLLQSSPAHSWLGSQGGSLGFIVKKTVRVDIPVEKYPTVCNFLLTFWYLLFELLLQRYLTFNYIALQYNFVGRLLGPRGNSLKRVEANTECRVLIRGRGSIKDPARVMTLVNYFVVEHMCVPLSYESRVFQIKSSLSSSSS